MIAYQQFLNAKQHLEGDHGFTPTFLPLFVFDFQKALIEWACQKGRAAIFADCGMGKTPIQLVWAQNVVERTNGRVLILTPLAVSYQTVEEAKKFQIDAERSTGAVNSSRIVVTNYEQLQHFHPTDFQGVVCDESSILKNFDGATKAVITDFMRKLPYRLLCTATPSPNDFMELGTSSEALGYLGYMDMLGMFFKNDQHSLHPATRSRDFHGMNLQGQWRFKAHAEQAFWRWVCSWARALRKPSDLGYSDAKFQLPSLTLRQHVVSVSRPLPGYLFSLPARGLSEQRRERRHTIQERCETTARLAMQYNVFLSWCHLNEEGDLLERLIPQSLQVAGDDSSEFKELAVLWFEGKLCICDNPVFRAKMSTWQRDRQDIGNATTRLTENNLKSAPNGIGQKTVSDGTITSTPTTTHTKRSGNEVERNKIRSTASGDGGMQPIRATEPLVYAQRNKHDSVTRRHDSPEKRGGMASPFHNTRHSSRRGVPFADAKPHQTNVEERAQESDDSISTTTTGQANSVACSVPPVTSVLESSTRTPPFSSAQPCICGHRSGVRRLISKPTIFGHGLNLQGCAHMSFFPSHSFEQYYQAVRRCWRFGQRQPVTVELVTSEGESDVMANLQRKAQAADRMFGVLVEQMHEAMGVSTRRDFTAQATVPAWLHNGHSA